MHIIFSRLTEVLVIIFGIKYQNFDYQVSTINNNVNITAITVLLIPIYVTYLRYYHSGFYSNQI